MTAAAVSRGKTGRTPQTKALPGATNPGEQSPGRREPAPATGSPAIGVLWYT